MARSSSVFAWLLCGLCGLCGMNAACSDAGDDSDWMAELDDDLGLAELTIPGTHDTGALFEPIAGLSRTQDLTIEEQLAAGVRYFDIRCRHVENAFHLYHGAVDQRQTYDVALATMYGFLDAHPGEVLIVSIMEEAAPAANTRSFEATFAAYTTRDPARWALDDTVPRLGDVRGKLVLLRRFPSTARFGLDATAWPDNSPGTFSIENAASLRVQDAYLVTDNDVKWAAITAAFTEARTSSALFLNYTSGIRLIDALSNIPTVSDDINARLDTWLADPANRRAHLGVLVMDHVTPARVKAVLSTHQP